MIWVPSDAEAWEPAQVVSSDNKTVTVKSKATNKSFKIPGPLSKYDTISAGSLDEECDNLVELESFSEGIILHHIKKRFSRDNIYTFVGNILIALNPYKPLDIYGLPLVDKIYNATKLNGKIPPHVFSIGAAAVYNMRHDERDQSVLISGESGAGKTEATKKILQFISTICGSTASRIGPSIENQILDSNPLLESFGNAKTIRNNNSSRFGKYMEVNFDKKHNIKGCNMKAYLLEKSRVVKQGPNERNYHIFYMFLAGASKDMKRNFALKPADQFYYLSQSGCMDVNRRSDLKEYEEMVYAMQSLNVDARIQNQIFQCLAAVLHLGNLSFAPARDVEGGSRATVPADCRRVAALLETNPDALERAMCTRVSVISGEKLVIPLPPEKAVDQRDTLSKYVYGKVFDQIVSVVNKSLYRGKPGPNIGVLDIFGFEVFALNSFEQLCINYCNERLQTFFNEIIFEGEMKMYSAEGLPCDDISFQDNMGCVRLIDLRGAGIFAYLDEEIVIPKGSDEKFVAKLNQIFDENAATKSLYFSRNRRNPMEFTVCHFAGDVTYNAKDFMEKNKDALAESLLGQVQQSTIPMLVTPEAELNGGGGGGATSSGKKKKGSKLTLAAKFKADLDSLMATLRSTVPHFIRCVKPNAEQAPTLFDGNLALNQLKYSGLFEAIRIRKSGYAVRMPVDAFVNRYKHAVLQTPKEVKADPVAHCRHLLEEIEKLIDFDELAAMATGGAGGGAAKRAKGASGAQQQQQHHTSSDTTGPGSGRHWVVGKTKVFIRTMNFKAQLEKVREKTSENCSVPLQKIVRGFIIRSRLVAKLASMRKLKEEKRQKEKAETALMRKEDLLSNEVEMAFRNDAELQKKLLDAKNERIRVETERKRNAELQAALLIQRIVRGGQGRRTGCTYMCERMLETALLKREEALINRAIAMPKKYGVTSKLIKVYQGNAKKLIMEVLNEAFVGHELDEAVEVGSVEMIREAIRRAEENHMPYLPQLRKAKKALNQMLHLRSVVTNLEAILVKCVSVPKLVANADVLEQLLQQAATLGLAGEYYVQSAAVRLSHVRNLITLRDRIRFAVELCCPSKIQSAMGERHKLLKIFGEDLLSEEAKAARGMFRMLNYQLSIDPGALNMIIQQSSSSSSGGGGGGGDSNNSSAEKKEEGEGTAAALSMKNLSAALEQAAAAGAGNDSNEDEGASKPPPKDIFLPVFVRKAMEDVLNADTSEDVQACMESLERILPDVVRRRFYLRVFKWVVAYATWKYSNHHGGGGGGGTMGTTGTGDGNSRSVGSPGNSLGADSLFAETGPAGGGSGSPFGSVHSNSSSGQKKTSPHHHHHHHQRSSPSVGATAHKDPSVVDGRRSSANAPGPYAQRQARSQVAAHRILKKGQAQGGGVDFGHKTDKLLAASIKEYEKFRPHVKTTFRG